MIWRYGIIKFRYKKDPKIRYYGIGEIYYKTKEQDKVLFCSEEPITIQCDEDENPNEVFLETLTRMQNDIKKYPQPFDADGPFEKLEDRNDKLVEWIDGEWKEIEENEEEI